MNEKEKQHISKFLSLVLRHKPETIELPLDENGWADVEQLLMQSAKHHRKFTKQELEETVITNDKQRFAFNTDKTKIRASQGHSIQVELQLPQVQPPEFLFHGTVASFVENIRKEGLIKRNRQHVHLSKDKDTATKVGMRRGHPVILTIKSGEMYKDQLPFFLSENKVWLTDHVPAKYIDFNDLQ